MHMRTNIYNYWIKFKTFCIQASNASPWAVVGMKPLNFLCFSSNPTAFSYNFSQFFLLDKKYDFICSQSEYKM